MGEQLIIAVSREFGSGGHAVAQLLSEKYNIPLYDSNLLEDIADQKNLDAQALGKYDEKSKASFLQDPSGASVPRRRRILHGCSSSISREWLMRESHSSLSEDARRRFSRRILIL